MLTIPTGAVTVTVSHSGSRLCTINLDGTRRVRIDNVRQTDGLVAVEGDNLRLPMNGYRLDIFGRDGVLAAGTVSPEGILEDVSEMYEGRVFEFGNTTLHFASPGMFPA